MASQSSSSPSSGNMEKSQKEKETEVQQISQHFADLNSKLCDHTSQQLKEVFAGIAPEFPRLEQPAVLLERLEKSYLRHVDVVEVYASRNIFTLDNLPPNRRARIANLFRTANEEADISLELREPEHKCTDESEASSRIDMDELKSSPPLTKEQVVAKRLAVEELQKKITAARQEQSILQRRVEELEIAQKVSSSWPNDSTADQVQESVSALMMGMHGVEDCQEQGEAAVQQNKKRRLENKDGETDERLVWDPLSPRPQNTEELYEQERKRVQASTKDLQLVHRMLVGNKAKD